MASERRTEFDPPITLTAEQVATLARENRSVVIYARLITSESVDEPILVGDYDAPDDGSAAGLEHDGSYSTGE